MTSATLILFRKPPPARRCSLGGLAHPPGFAVRAPDGRVLASAGRDRADGPFQSTRTTAPHASPADCAARSVAGSVQGNPDVHRNCTADYNRFVSLPERACVVKGGLCGLFRWEAIRFRLRGQTFYAMPRVLGSSPIVSCCDSFVSRLVMERRFRLVRVLRSSFARSVRSFFSMRDRASTRPFVDARGR